jgi:hypothetical protein
MKSKLWSVLVVLSVVVLSATAAHADEPGLTYVDGSLVGYTNLAPLEPSGDGTCVWIEAGTGYNWNGLRCLSTSPSGLGFLCQSRS